MISSETELHATSPQVEIVIHLQVYYVRCHRDATFLFDYNLNLLDTVHDLEALRAQ